MFLGVFESISAVVKAVEFQEQQELLAADVVTQYTLLYPLWGLSIVLLAHRGPTDVLS